MKVLSLFDGMACGMIAMLNAGIEVESYDAYEIDKYAIKVSTHNFPNIHHHGDVFQADFTQYEGVDFLVGGSPCTYWSIAQKNNRETEASGMGWELFSQYVRAVKEAKPKFFIYENNKSMSAAIRESIDQAFGFEAVCINSSLVSAQNRQRLYWVGARNEDGTYRKVPVEQPSDRQILLVDVLDNAIAWQDKSHAYTTRCQSAIIGDTLAKSRHTMVAEPINMTSEGKSQCLRATCYKDTVRNIIGNNIDRRTGVAEPCKVGAVGNGGQGNRVYSVCGKAVAQTAASGGIGSNTGLYAVPIEFDGKKPVKAISGTDGKEYLVYEVKGGRVTINGKQYPIKLADGYYIFRKLTVTECMRLQTVPEWYDFGVISNSQAYKCLGNGWTCDVITHLVNATQKATRKKWLDDLLGDCL